MLCLYFQSLPKWVKKLDKWRIDFLWLGDKEGKGMHLVNWAVAQLSKNSGRAWYSKFDVPE